MSDSTIDGTGSGYLAKVDDTNRLFTRAVASTPEYEAVTAADHYLISSGFITLTDDAKSSVIRLQNDEEQDLFIDRIILTSEDSVGGTHDHYLFSGTKNATGISGGTGVAANVVNNNFGSTKLLANSSERGQQDATTTGGSIIFAAYFNDGATEFINQRLLLQTGNSITFEITPSVNNTSFDVAVGINCHLVKP